MAAKETKPTGIKPPSRIGRPSGLAKPSAKTSSVASSRTQSPDGSKKVDDYIIGDRVYVAGTKPGVIAYLGETKFAGGDWAGIILDDLEGKNDGTVQGVRYFQCEPKRGVFAKPAKLSRHKVNSADAAPGPAAAISGTPKVSKISGQKGMSSSQALPKRNGSISASNTSLSSAALATVGAKHIKVGERVVVNGSKVGILRFLGTTDFAAGEWAGVELGEAIGKNDGSVGGKRYFECQPLYGLFAPVHKVTKESVQPMSPTTGGRTTPSLSHQRQPHRLCSTPSMSSMLNSKTRDLCTSQDSLNSIGSAISTASRSRVRLGVTSLQTPKAANQQTAGNRVAQARNAYKSVSTAAAASSAGLQKALKEKEEHIEQLIRERELERSEVFKASVQKEELEEELSKVKSEFQAVAIDADFRVNELELKIEQLQAENKELESSLKEQKTNLFCHRKLEDLQFQMEEEAISRGENEGESSGLADTVDQLKKELQEEGDCKRILSERISTLQSELEKASSQLSDSQHEGERLASEVTALKGSLSALEDQLASQRMGSDTATNKNSELERLLSEKDNSLQNLTEKSSQQEETVQRLTGDLETTKQAQTQLEKDLKESHASSEKLLAKQSDLLAELEKLAAEKANVSTELGDTKLLLSEAQRSLETSEGAKTNLLTEKDRLQQHIDELVKNSGDSGQQLSLLNDELREKTRKLGALQEALAESNNNGEKLQELMTLAAEEHKLELAILTSKSEKTTSALESDILELEKKLSSAQEGNVESAVAKDKEINSLMSELTRQRQQLDENLVQSKQLESAKKEAEKTVATLSSRVEELETVYKEQAARVESAGIQCVELEQEVFKLREEKESRGKEVSQLQARQVDNKSECDRLKQKLSESRSELEAAQQEKSAAFTERDDLRLQISDLERAVETAAKTKAAITSDKHKLEKQVEDLMRNSGDSSQQLTLFNEDLQEKNRKVESLQESLSDASNQTKKLEELLERSKESHKSELSSLNAQHQKVIAALQSDLDNITSQKSDLEKNSKEQVEELRLALSSANEKCAQVKADQEIGLKNSQRLDTQLSDLTLKQESLSTTIAELERLLSEKDNSLQNLTEKSSQQEETVQRLTGELETSRQTQTQLETQLKSREQAADKLTNENSSLRGDLEASQSEKSALDKELKDIRLAKADALRALESAETLKENLSEEKAKLENQVDNMLKSSSQTHQQQAALHDELKDKERKLESLQESLFEATNNSEKIQELLDRAKEEHKLELSSLNALMEKRTDDLKAEISSLDAAKTAAESNNEARVKELSEQILEEKKAAQELRATFQLQLSEKDSLLAATTEAVGKLELAVKVQREETAKAEENLRNIKEEVDRLSLEKESLGKQLTSEKGSITQHEQEVEKLKSVIEVHQQEMEKQKALLAQSSSDFEKTSQEKDAQMEDLEKQVKALEDLSETTRVELESRLEQAKSSADESAFKLEEQLMAVKSENESLQALIDDHVKEQTALADQLVAAKTELSHSEKSVTESMQEINQLKLSVQSAEEAKEQLQTKVFSLEEASLDAEEQAKSAKIKCEMLTKKVSVMESEIGKSAKKADLEKATLTVELESKQQQLEIQTSLIEKYEHEIKHLKSQVSASSGDTSLIRDLKTQLTKLEDERDDFKKEAEDLTFKLEELSLSKGAGAGDAGSDSDRYQIDFLNSVIVDQKGKIDELNHKIKVLAEVGDVEPNGYELDFSADFAEETRKPPPRLFCDICDVFDAHDTDDCPIQAQDDDGPAPSYHHEERGTNRAYCDACEVFGHDTEDCEEQDEW
ncbi:CAP-Gly domain-containing linker protein 1-like [Watersipora subatra]|uniref:CAP-Gly domain-containing linker protein 1-like n=1 Tax=Watersipora subatra TaxID=2589382 RepID=UPI00355C3862